MSLELFEEELPWAENKVINTIPYTVKHSRGKTLAFRVGNGYSLENFCVSMLVDIYCQLTKT